ncbi:hypothetical protein EJV47_22050 [Hymenobacter gummosus]|uniref:DUF2007 domain-containing protein n=1 Tax=Hymenobacter gummosus TaxID=1776032 RepID=A0A431TX66_9BACT|nr:hypothetical protein [Hymenobacter gummosus]RTQ46217.1 hypothetical protein EJV47_22050 [Hymenobacter gummosus]
MPDSGFIQYQQFSTAGAAQALLALLEEHDIPYQTSRTRPAAEPSFAFHDAHQGYLVHLRPADVPRANALQDEENRRLIADADPGHYLFGFTDQELMDVLAHRADWSRYDVQLAEHLLRQRGHAPEVQGLQQLHTDQARQLPAPERSRPGWLIWGYVTALLGGVGGILLGWHLYSSRETLPDGRQHHTFSAHDRVHGLWIMGLGLVALLGFTALRLLAG